MLSGCLPNWTIASDRHDWLSHCSADCLPESSDWVADPRIFKFSMFLKFIKSEIMVLLRTSSDFHEFVIEHSYKKNEYANDSHSLQTDVKDRLDTTSFPEQFWAALEEV